MVQVFIALDFFGTVKQQIISVRFFSVLSNSPNCWFGFCQFGQINGAVGSVKKLHNGEQIDFNELPNQNNLSTVRKAQTTFVFELNQKISFLISSCKLIKLTATKLGTA